MRRVLTLLPMGLLVALCAFAPTVLFGQDSLGINKTGNDTQQVNAYPTLDTNSIKPLNDSLKPDASKVNVWGTLGGTLIGWSGGFNCNMNKNLVSLHHLQFQHLGKIFSGDGPEPVYKELGLLYGRILTNSKSNFYCSVSAGISRMIIKERVKIGELVETDLWYGTTTTIIYEDRNYAVFGYPIKCEVMYRRKYFGIGLNIIANVNPKNDYLQGFYVISIGRLK